MHHELVVAVMAPNSNIFGSYPTPTILSSHRGISVLLERCYDKILPALTLDQLPTPTHIDTFTLRQGGSLLRWLKSVSICIEPLSLFCQ